MARFRTGDPAPDEAFIERFWAKIQGAERADGCWIWSGACSRKSHGCYGIVRGPRPTYTVMSAARVMLFLVTGDGGEGREACHRDGCTDTRCVNPAHLYWGTRQENYMDNERKYGRGTKGRSRRGFGGRRPC